MAALAAVGGLGLGLVVHLVKYAYDQGRSEQRIASLERNQSDIGQSQNLLGALTATVTGLKESVDGLQDAVNEIRRQVFRQREA